MARSASRRRARWRSARLKASRADVAVSITGVAGPGGGSAEKPVGLVHFGVAGPGDRLTTLERRFGDIGRGGVRRAALAQALAMLEQAVAQPNLVERSERILLESARRSAQPKTMTIEEFVAWEERQELRYEFDGYAARAMTGGTYAHSVLQTNLLCSLSNALRGGPRRALGNNLKVRTNIGVRYPDALITCSRADPLSTFAPDPVVIFEIRRLQELGIKNAEYQALPSLSRYVVLQQTAAAAEVFQRDPEGEWTHTFVSAQGELEMPEVGITIPLSDIYAEVEFAA